MREKQYAAEPALVAATAALTAVCEGCGSNEAVLSGGKLLCWDCILDRVDDEADKDAVREMLENDRDQVDQVCKAPGQYVEETAPVRPAVEVEYTEEMAERDRKDLFG